jgi:pilus assembly protein CpaB
MTPLPLRSLMFGSIAVVLGGATLFLGQAALRAQNQNAAPALRPAAEISSRRILVAARPLSIGDRVTTGDLAWRPWPVAGIDPSHIVEGSRPLDAFADTVVRTDILAGEPITAARVTAPTSRSTLAMVTRPGLRAVSVALTPTSGVSGLIAPGDRVDVVLTYALPRPEGQTGSFERRAATTILSDLRVLAIDQRLSTIAPIPVPGAAIVEFRNASLEVTVKQSEALALAADLGKLSLSLRGLEEPGDRANGVVGGSTLDYQVGRLLPGLTRARAAIAGRRATGTPTVAQFHGSKPDGAGFSQ